MGGALAVLDATGTDRASLVTLSRSTWQGVILAAEHPERVERLVLTACALDPAPRGGPDFHAPVGDNPKGWAKFNAGYWRTHYREFLEFFFAQVSSEPHSTKQHEDAVAWGLETTPEILIATIDEWQCHTPLADLLARVRCPHPPRARDGGPRAPLRAFRAGARGDRRLRSGRDGGKRSHPEHARPGALQRAGP